MPLRPRQFLPVGLPQWWRGFGPIETPRSEDDPELGVDFLGMTAPTAQPSSRNPTDRPGNEVIGVPWPWEDEDDDNGGPADDEDQDNNGVPDIYEQGEDGGESEEEPVEEEPFPDTPPWNPGIGEVPDWGNVGVDTSGIPGRDTGYEYEGNPLEDVITGVGGGVGGSVGNDLNATGGGIVLHPKDIMDLLGTDLGEMDFYGGVSSLLGAANPAYKLLWDFMGAPIVDNLFGGSNDMTDLARGNQLQKALQDAVFYGALGREEGGVTALDTAWYGNALQDATNRYKKQHGVAPMQSMPWYGLNAEGLMGLLEDIGQSYEERRARGEYVPMVGTRGGAYEGYALPFDPRDDYSFNYDGNQYLLRPDVLMPNGQPYWAINSGMNLNDYDADFLEALSSTPGAGMTPYGPGVSPEFQSELRDRVASASDLFKPGTDWRTMLGYDQKLADQLAEYERRLEEWQARFPDGLDLSNFYPMGGP